MISSEKDGGGSHPLPTIERFYQIGEAKYRTCAGLHLLFAGAATGKSLLSISWAAAISEPVTWLYINEPGGKFIKPNEVPQRILAADKSFVLVDSLSLYLLAASGGGGAAMKGGLTLGMIDAVTSLDQAAREKGKVVVGIVNTSVLPIVIDDAMVHGLLSVNIGARELTWRDRASGRTDTTLTLTEDQLKKGCEFLGYKAPPPATPVNAVDANVALTGIKPVTISEKRI